MEILFLVSSISSGIAAAFTIITQYLLAQYQRDELASQNAEVRRNITMLEIKIEDIQTKQDETIDMVEKTYTNTFDALHQLKEMNRKNLYGNIDKNKKNDEG
jgi:flavin-dependent dehydrogenase